jgi:hypothetical protein
MLQIVGGFNIDEANSDHSCPIKVTIESEVAVDDVRNNDVVAQDEPDDFVLIGPMAAGSVDGLHALALKFPSVSEAAKVALHQEAVNALSIEGSGGIIMGRPSLVVTVEMCSVPLEV